MFSFDHPHHRIMQVLKSERIRDYQSEGIKIMDISIKGLHMEFEGILRRPTDKLKTENYPSSESSTNCSSSLSTFDYELQDSDFVGHGGLSTCQVSHLRHILNRLNSTGSPGDCIEAYRTSRKSVVDVSFVRFGIGSISDIRNSDWEEVVVKMKLWIRAAHICFRIIFPREKQNFEEIFEGVESATYDNCYLFITRDVAIQLCNFAEVITTTPASLQKLFDVLDMYNALLVLLPQIKKTFRPVSSENIYLRAATIVNWLESLVRKILSTFEDTVLHEQLNTPAPGGMIHSVTRYTMDYVIQILCYKELLAGIIISKPTASLGISYGDAQFLEVEGRTPLALHLIWIIICLKSNLECKSKHYVDDALGHFFLLNNILYIVKKIEGSLELLEMIGVDYLNKLNEYANQAKYLTTWNGVLYCLRDEGLFLEFPFYRKISRTALKKRLKIFNSRFEEVCQTQSTWVIADLEIRSHFHELILDKLIPVYESFLMNYRSHIEKERCPEKYIKWTVGDLKKAVHGLFPGYKLAL